MKRKLAFLLVAALMFGLVAGCGAPPAEMPTETAEETLPEPEATAEPTLPIPPDGAPNDVTCQGSYTGTLEQDAIVARAGNGELTNSQLQVWYRTAIANFLSNAPDVAPDFSVPLESQPCEIDGSVNSWQQYFLKLALENWHTAQALDTHSREVPLVLEEAFDPPAEYREENMVDIPAMKYLYGENTHFVPNTMHQAYLDNIPQMLDTLAAEKGYADGADLAAAAFGTTEAALQEMVTLYNRSYMYATEMSYDITVTDEEIEAWFSGHEAQYAQQGITRESGYYVDFRQILLIPEADGDLTVEIGADGTVTCEEKLWKACKYQAEVLLNKWRSGGRPRSEGTFSNLANKNSQDAGTAADGGAYRRIAQGQMIEALDTWIFDSARREKDVTILRTEYGIHILFFSGKTEIWRVHSEEDLVAQKQRELVLTSRETYPMTVDYSSIILTEAGTGLTLDALLYEDLAHERFPEVPLYLQQDYPDVWYGEYLLRTHGCGITSFAMLSSYMMDDELTPPEMCRLYGRYNTLVGTDVSLYEYEPAEMGYYNYLVYDEDKALEALKQGYMVISLQNRGYWTRGGHYIVLEKLNEDGTVQVRDSNVLNYGTLEGHKQDKHTWESITKNNRVMWIFDKKLTRVNACSRCGDCQGVTESLLEESYLCHKCRPALLRREAYLSMFA